MLRRLWKLSLVGVILLPVAGANHDATPLALETVASSLPDDGLFSTSAVWDGSRYAYLFGGTSGKGDYADAILRYDEATSTLEEMSGRLPTGRAGTAAAWLDGYAYVFGGSWEVTESSGDHGHSYRALSDEIVRYDPRTDTVRVMEARLPTPRWGASAVTDGHFIYSFGGHDGAYVEEPLKYDPRADKLETLPGRVGGIETAAVWANDFAYVWAGHYPSRYDPRTGELLAQMGMGPCEGCWARQGRTSSVFDGTALYLFGGEWLNYPTDQILRYDLETNNLTILDSKLPPPGEKPRYLPGRMSTSAIWTGVYAYIFGGEKRDAEPGFASREILRFHPGPESPPESTAAPTGDTSQPSPSVKRDLPGPAVLLFLVAVAGIAGFRRL